MDEKMYALIHDRLLDMNLLVCIHPRRVFFWSIKPDFIIEELTKFKYQFLYWLIKFDHIIHAWKRINTYAPVRYEFLLVHYII